MKVNYLIAYLLYLFITSQSVRFGLKKKYRYVMILVLIDRPEGELNNRPLLIFYSILARPTTFCFIVREFFPASWLSQTIYKIYKNVSSFLRKILISMMFKVI